MRREFRPSPLREAMPLLRWLFVFIVVSAIYQWWLFFWLCTVIFLFHATFHRSPRRQAPNDPAILVAPADGKVTDVTEVDEPKFIKGKAHRVRIFLSVFDVHTQPAPCDATLKLIDYQPGQFFDARCSDASKKNECQFLGLETPDGIRVVVKQIAGFIARRIILWRLPNEQVHRGELLGMIRYGSRVELYLPSNSLEVLVTKDAYVQGGKTPVARRKPRSKD